jgi:hypothetical protein
LAPRSPAAAKASKRRPGSGVRKIAVNLLERGQIHQRGGVVGLENEFVDELRAQRAEIGTIEGKFRQLGDPDRHVIWRRAAHAALAL